MYYIKYGIMQPLERIIMKIGRLEITWAFEPWWRFIFPFFYYDPMETFEKDDGKRHFLKPHFKIRILKGKPCPTKWLYDWYAQIGWLYLDMHSKG